MQFIQSHKSPTQKNLVPFLYTLSPFCFRIEFLKIAAHTVPVTLPPTLFRTRFGPIPSRGKCSRKAAGVLHIGQASCTRQPCFPEPVSPRQLKEVILLLFEVRSTLVSGNCLVLLLPSNELLGFYQFLRALLPVNVEMSSRVVLFPHFYFR